MAGVDGGGGTDQVACRGGPVGGEQVRVLEEDEEGLDAGGGRDGRCLHGDDGCGGGKGA